MDDLDQLRTDHSREMLAKGRLELETNPQLGFYHIWSARLLLISMRLKNSGKVPESDVADFVREINAIISTHNIDLHLVAQNELLVLALAAGDVAGARQLAKKTCLENTSHKFDRLLNRKLRSILIQTDDSNDLGYRPTKSEQPMFDDLDKIRESQNCSFEGADKYWRATKSRRYANTGFQHVNLFRLAFQVLQSAGWHGHQ